MGKDKVRGDVRRIRKMLGEMYDLMENAFFDGKCMI